LFSLFLICRCSQEEALSFELWEAGTCGIQEEPGGLRAFFEDDAAAAAQGQQFEAYHPQLRTEQTVDWAQVSRDAWPPLEIGERFFLTPPWCNDPVPVGRLRLEMTPGMACGTGHHPATQLCLEALERTVQPGDTLVDIGTGSGILSAGARLLGAGSVIACDIDPEAVRLAAERLITPVFVGSADAIQASSADIVVANISSAAAEELSAEFARIGKRNSTLILSGFPEWDTPRGYAPKVELKRAGWVCWIC
jgi:ribosomal protein L11 methyltransferase